MCGITGYILKTNKSGADAFLYSMSTPIIKRGPDDEGVCLINRANNTQQHFKTNRTVSSLNQAFVHIQSEEAAQYAHDVALVHTRYSIIDLSSKAHQPFISQDNDIIAIFNGEIYNYIELKEELIKEGICFKTNSDTEVLVLGYKHWGLELFKKMNGFWAICIYDQRNQSILLSRDRIGVAPLYYTIDDEGLYFSSTIDSLKNIGNLRPQINQDSLLGFIQTGIKDHDDSTLYEKIKTLPAATTVIISKDQTSFNITDCIKYWDLPQKRKTEKDLSFKEAVDTFRTTFFNAVDIRLRADVKVAFELSGGLDSSSVVAAAAALGHDHITTYTADVEGSNDEAYASSMLKKYNLDYHVIDKMEDSFAKNVEDFQSIMEEPYDNPNDYTHHQMLHQMKRDGVDVIVTGAGGDEHLAGYETSFWPQAYRELKNQGFQKYCHADWHEFRKRFFSLKKTKHTLHHYLFDSLKLVSGKRQRANNNSCLDLLKKESTSALQYQKQFSKLNFHDRALYHFNVALIPYYMRSSDHFTMGIPIEHRFPLLDYRIVECGMQMPLTYLFKGGWSKYLLRKAMEPYLPKKITWRRDKLGFYFPYQTYFIKNRDQFKPYLKELQSIPSLSKIELNYDLLCKTNAKLLWRLLSTAIWLKHERKG